jgi:hypothetical protein
MACISLQNRSISESSSEVDRYRIDAEPRPDPTSHFDAGSDPDPAEQGCGSRSMRIRIQEGKKGPTKKKKVKKLLDALF